MKRLARVVGTVGLLLMIGLIVHEGTSAILALLSQAGWILLWLVPLHALPLLLDVMGWRTLLDGADPQRHTRLGTLFGLGALREAINRLLPVASVGGEIVALRLLVLRGVPGAAAAASVIVEMMLVLISQFTFVALGLVCLLRVSAARHWVVNLVTLLLVAALPIIVAVLLLLRYGSIFERGGRWIERMFAEDSQWRRRLSKSGAIDDAVRLLYRSPARLLGASGWQLSGLIAGTLETWLALRWLAHPITLGNALALESVVQAVRSFMFVVPASMGVQEAGLIALGALLGVSGPAAVALSLVKRLREIVFGLPVLLGWQWYEGRRARALAATQATSAQSALRQLKSQGP
jgi:putative membrane protein